MVDISTTNIVRRRVVYYIKNMQISILNLVSSIFFLWQQYKYIQKVQIIAKKNPKFLSFFFLSRILNTSNTAKLACPAPIRSW